MWKFGNVSFWGEGKIGVPGEKTLGAGTRTNNKLNPYITPRFRESNPDHIGKRRVLSSLRHPCATNFSYGILSLRDTGL